LTKESRTVIPLVVIFVDIKRGEKRNPTQEPEQQELNNNRLSWMRFND